MNLSDIYDQLKEMRSQGRVMLHELRENHGLGVIEDTFTCMSIDLQNIIKAVEKELKGRQHEVRQS
jgi:hypothetical protein